MRVFFTIGKCQVNKGFNPIGCGGGAYTLAASAHQQHPCISSIRASKKFLNPSSFITPSHPQKSSQTLYCSPLTQLWSILAGRNSSLH